MATILVKQVAAASPVLEDREPGFDPATDKFYVGRGGTNREIGGAGGGGTVTTVSVASANGFAGTVADATTTPAITLSTTVTGLLKGDGTAISAAVADTDYATPAGVVSYVSANYSPLGHTHPQSDITDLVTDLAAKQPLDATLTAFAALTIAANSLTIGTGADAFSQVTFAANRFPARASTGDLEAKTITDFGLSLVDDADASAARTTLGLVIGTHVQAFHANLSSVAGLTLTGNAGKSVVVKTDETGFELTTVTGEGTGTGTGDVPLFNAFTDAEPALPDIFPGFDVSAGDNRDFVLEKMLGLLRTSPGGRLSLVLDNPVADDATGTTIYWMPYLDDVLILWDGTRWVAKHIPQIKIVTAGVLTSGKPHDLFAFTSTATPSSTNTSTDIVTFGSATGWETGSVVRVETTGGGLTAETDYYWSAASSTTGSFHTSIADVQTAANKVDLTASITSAVTGVSLEKLAWTDDTTRATAVTYQDGRLCKSGDKTRLLLGTFYAVDANTVTDTETQRYLSNVYNRVPRSLATCPGYTDDDALTSYTLNSTTYIRLNGGTGATVQWVSTVKGIPMFASMTLLGDVGAVAGNIRAGIGIDSTTTPKTALFGIANTRLYAACSVCEKNLAAGAHSANMLGCTDNAANATIFGDINRDGASADPQSTTLRGWVMG